MVEIALGARTAVRRPARALRIFWPFSSKETIVCVILFTLLFLGLVSLKAKSTSLGYEIARNRRAVEVLEEVNRKTLADVAALKSPQRIEKLAREKLGLVYPAPEQLIVMPKGGE